MDKKESIDIILVTFKRLHLLKQAVQKIYERTRYPYRLWVVNNDITDVQTIRFLKGAKTNGFLYDFFSLPKNNGLAPALTEGFKKVKSEYFVTTQDDVVPPDLSPCWLERLLHLINKYPEYGAIACRTQRIRHRQVDEDKELIDSPTSLATFFRIQKRSDIEQVGGFGNRPHWESPEIMKRMKQLKKKLAVATHLYCEDLGFMVSNKGYDKNDTQYNTYSKERVNQGELQPYPEVDPKTCIPLKINTIRDEKEQSKRDAYYDYWGRDGRKRHKTLEQLELARYAEKGKGVDLGCGMVKVHENALGVDLYPHKCVDILHDCRDLWMFQDNELDFVVNAHTLEHMPDFITTLKEWRRVLKTGGIMGIAVPDGEVKPEYILKQGHKLNIGLNTLKIVFKHILKMKTIRAEHVKGKKEGQHVALIVGKKR